MDKRIMGNVKKVLVCCLAWMFCGIGMVFASETKMEGDPAFLDYDGDFHKDVIAPQVRAWKQVAKVSFPKVCDDTENEWACWKVDSIADMILANPGMPKGEQLASLYEMENYAAYGMTYLVAIFGYHITPEATQDALAIIPQTEDVLHAMRENNFRNVQQFIDLEKTVYMNYCIFMFLNSQLVEGTTEIVDDMISTNLYNEKVLEALMDVFKNDTQLYRYSQYVFSNSFYLTFCPLAFWLGGPEFSNSNMEEYMEIGGWIDSCEVPIVKALGEGKKLPSISLEDYSAFLKQVSYYRARLIELLAKAIESMPLPEQDDEE